MLDKLFGDRLREAREAAGLSQLDVASKLGVKGGMTVYRWEKGQSFPGLPTVERLCDLLHKPAPYFFGGAIPGVSATADVAQLSAEGTTLRAIGDDTPPKN